MRLKKYRNTNAEMFGNENRKERSLECEKAENLRLKTELEREMTSKSILQGRWYKIGGTDGLNSAWFCIHCLISVMQLINEKGMNTLTQN